MSGPEELNRPSVSEGTAGHEALPGDALNAAIKAKFETASPDQIYPHPEGEHWQLLYLESDTPFPFSEGLVTITRVIPGHELEAEQSQRLPKGSKISLHDSIYVGYTEENLIQTDIYASSASEVWCRILTQTIFTSPVRPSLRQTHQPKDQPFTKPDLVPAIAEWIKDSRIRQVEA